MTTVAEPVGRVGACELQLVEVADKRGGCHVLGARLSQLLGLRGAEPDRRLQDRSGDCFGVHGVLALGQDLVRSECCRRWFHRRRWRTLWMGFRLRLQKLGRSWWFATA